MFALLLPIIAHFALSLQTLSSLRQKISDPVSWKLNSKMTPVFSSSNTGGGLSRVKRKSLSKNLSKLLAVPYLAFLEGDKSKFEAASLQLLGGDSRRYASMKECPVLKSEEIIEVVKSLKDDVYSSMFSDRKFSLLHYSREKALAKVILSDDLSSEFYGAQLTLSSSSPRPTQVILSENLYFIQRALEVTTLVNSTFSCNGRRAFDPVFYSIDELEKPEEPNTKKLIAFNLTNDKNDVDSSKQAKIPSKIKDTSQEKEEEDNEMAFGDPKDREKSMSMNGDWPKESQPLFNDLRDENGYSPKIYGKQGTKNEKVDAASTIVNWRSSKNPIKSESNK